MSETKFLNELDGFKVGDRVKVINYYIREFNGMTGTIYKIDADGCLNFDVILDNFTDGHNGHAGDRSTNHRFFSVPDLELLSSTWHNVGDWVQVRSYLSTEKSYGGIYPSEQMLHKVGQKVRIKAVTKTGRYKIDGSCFTWTNEMFEEEQKSVKQICDIGVNVGDVVIATNEFYALTNKGNNWMGVVIKVHNNLFDAVTITADCNDIPQFQLFEDLHRVHFKVFHKCFTR